MKRHWQQQANCLFTNHMHALETANNRSSHTASVGKSPV